MNKRGQINLSFGMIFSIVLIIAFVGFAVYAIQQFLGLQNSLKISTFYDTLQNDVNTVWNNAQTTKSYSYNLPTYIKDVCFTSAGSDDLIIYGDKSRPEGSHNINNLNITAITQSNSCFNVTNGQVNMVLEKKFSDTTVTIANE